MWSVNVTSWGEPDPTVMFPISVYKTIDLIIKCVAFSVFVVVVLVVLFAVQLEY